MSNQSSGKTIAKNTMFLYFRMMFTMLVSLFTSRVVLQKLGVEDYGLYQTVGGIVGFLSFLNSALSTGSSRFLTYELGTGDNDKLKRVFSTTLTIHILLAIVVVVLAETLGLWFLHHKLVVPAERMEAAVWTFHISILTAVFTLTQVPYNASIISHEKMSVFAYMSIYEVSAKLGVVYLLSVGTWDKLKMYSSLLFLVSVSMMVFYRIYCTRHFFETKYDFHLDKKIFREIAGFSGWSLFANLSIALNNQGILILLNIFFAPAIVAARAISIQVNMAVNHFVNNFRTAVNPQIVKRLASGDLEGSKRLLLASTRYSFYLMFILCFPICLTARTLLHLWLSVVPEYTVVFLQLIVVESIFHVFDSSFYTALYAVGRLRENALVSPMLMFLRFAIIYILFKAGCSPVALSWAGMINYMILGLVIKPVLIIKYAHYTWNDILSVLRPCLTVALFSVPIPILYTFVMNQESIFGFVSTVVLAVFITGLMVLRLGINEYERSKFVSFALMKFRRMFKR